MPFEPRKNRRGARSLWALAATLLAGCAQILGIEPLERGPADAGPADARPRDAAPADATPIDAGPDTTCSEGVIENATGATPIDTAPAGNDLAATCGGESSPDQVMLWTAPVTDYYVFDTFGSSFDTVLALFDECGGVELACSNNVGELGQSELVRKFRQGQQALVLIDGTAGDSGPGVLNIQPVTCPEADLEGQSFPLELTTLQSGDDFSSQCGGVGFEDRAFHWVAPSDGLYYFHATSDSFRPTVALLGGPRCTDRVLGCSPSSSGPHGAEVVRFLRAGQPVTVVVDGMDGAGLFRLDIGIKAGETCPEQDLIPGTTLLEDFTPRTLAPSCDITRHEGVFGGMLDTADRVYAFPVSGVGAPCFGECTVTVRSMNQPIVLYALEGGDCGGAEISCVKQLPDINDNVEASIELRALEVDTVYTVVVSDPSPLDSNSFEISGECFIACP